MFELINTLLGNTLNMLFCLTYPQMVVIFGMIGIMSRSVKDRIRFRWLFAVLWIILLMHLVNVHLVRYPTSATGEPLGADWVPYALITHKSYIVLLVAGVWFPLGLFIIWFLNRTQPILQILGFEQPVRVAETVEAAPASQAENS